MLFKVDRRLNRYLKEMANVRKRERRMALMASKSKASSKKNAVASETGGSRTGSRTGSRSGSLLQSPNFTPQSARGI